MVLFCCFPSLSVMRIFNPFLDFTRDTATYNCPWENTDLGRYNPTFDRVWPWLLLIVIANATFNGNCLRRILNGSFVSEGVISILCNHTVSPTLVPVITFASIIWFASMVICNRVPLHKPSSGSIFLIIITGVPTLSLRVWLGSPEMFIPLRNSGQKIESSFELVSVGSILSELK